MRLLWCRLFQADAEGALQWVARAYPQYVAVFTTVDDAIVVCGGSRTNRLAKGPNGCGLVVLDVEEAVHLGDLEQVVDPLIT
jgi:hypothetical protein